MCFSSQVRSVIKRSVTLSDVALASREGPGFFFFPNMLLTAALGKTVIKVSELCVSNLLLVLFSL